MVYDHVVIEECENTKLQVQIKVHKYNKSAKVLHRNVLKPQFLKYDLACKQHYMGGLIFYKLVILCTKWKEVKVQYSPLKYTGGRVTK